MADLCLVTNNGQTRRPLYTITEQSRARHCVPYANVFSAACALMREDELEEGADRMSAGI
jgi:hypothetical protein